MAHNSSYPQHRSPGVADIFFRKGINLPFPQKPKEAMATTRVDASHTFFYYNRFSHDCIKRGRHGRRKAVGQHRLGGVSAHLIADGRRCS